MKKTNRTNKLTLDRQIIRELTPTELQQPAGGMGRSASDRDPTQHVTCSCCGNCDNPSVGCNVGG